MLGYLTTVFAVFFENEFDILPFVFDGNIVGILFRSVVAVFANRAFEVDNDATRFFGHT